MKTQEKRQISTQDLPDVFTHLTFIEGIDGLSDRLIIGRDIKFKPTKRISIILTKRVKEFLLYCLNGNPYNDGNIKVKAEAYITIPLRRRSKK